MRTFAVILFVILNVCLIESANRTEDAVDADDALIKFKSDQSANEGKAETEANARFKSVRLSYGDRGDGNVDNFISKKNVGPDDEEESKEENFPNEVFLTLRNLTSGGNAAFRGFTHKNDIEDLQASATDNVNVTAANDTRRQGTTADDSVGVNQRALRDAGHPPFGFHEDEVYPPFKPNTIDNADFSDCARQGEWKPIGVDSSFYAHSSLDVGGGQGYVGQHGLEGLDGLSHGHDNHEHHNANGHGDILESVGSYPVANKVIPHWHDNFLSNLEQVSLPQNHKPSFPTGAGDVSHGASGFGSVSSHGGVGGYSGFGGGLGQHSLSFGGGGGGSALSSAEQFQKIKSSSMLSPPPLPPLPPLPPVVLGKKPGHLKSHKSKHKFHHDKRKRPGGPGSAYFPFGANGGGNSGSFSSHGSHGGSFGGGHIKHGGGGFGGGSGFSGGGFKHGSGGFSGGSSGFSSGFKHGSGGYGGGFNGFSGHFKHGHGNVGGGLSGGFKHGGGSFGGVSSNGYYGGFKHGGGSGGGSFGGAGSGGGSGGFSGPYKHGHKGFGGDTIVLTGHLKEENGGFGGGTTVFTGHLQDASGGFGGDTTILTGNLQEGNGGYGSGAAVITGHIKDGNVGLGGDATVFTGTAYTGQLHQVHQSGGAPDFTYSTVNTGSPGYGGDFGGSDFSQYNSGGGYSNVFSVSGATEPKDILHYDGGHSSDSILIQHNGGGGDSINSHSGITSSGEDSSHGYDDGNTGSNVHHSESANVLHYESGDTGSDGSHGHVSGIDSAISSSGSGNVGGVVQTSSEDFGHQSLTTTTNLVQHDGGSGGSGAHVGALAFPGGDLIFGSTVLLNSHPGALPSGDVQSVSPYPPDFGPEAAPTNLVATASSGYTDLPATGTNNLITGPAPASFDHVGGGGGGGAGAAGAAATAGGGTGGSSVVVESVLPSTTLLATHISHGAGDNGKLIPDSTYLPSQISQGTTGISSASDTTYISGHVIDGGSPLSDVANLLTHGSTASASTYLSGNGGNGASGNEYQSDHTINGANSVLDSSGYFSGHGLGDVGLSGSGSHLSGQGSGSSLSGYLSGHGTRGGNSLSSSAYSSHTHGTRGGNSLSGSSGYHSGSLSYGNGGSLSGSSNYLSSHGSGNGGSLSSSSGYLSGHHGGGSGTSASDSTYLATQAHPGFVLHAHGVLDDSSTFTCGKHHDHNTNYHTATFQVADNDYPSSVDIIKYHGDSAVIVRSDPPFHKDLYSERKNFNSEGEPITTDGTGDAIKDVDDAAKEAPNKHNQIQEVNDEVVEASQYSINSRKPQTFSQQTEFDSQVSSAGDGDPNEFSSQVDQVKGEASQTLGNPSNSVPATFNKVKLQRPGKPQFYQKFPKNPHQGKPPFPLKQKQTHFQNKQNYNLHESRGERYIPLSDVSSQASSHLVGTPRPRNGAKLHRYRGNQHRAPALLRKPESPKVVRVVRS